MSAKTSAYRRGLFLKFLSETGNQTVSAERAKVSRSWVSLQRSQDAGFDAACVGAIEAARAGLRSQPPLPAQPEAESPAAGSNRPVDGPLPGAPSKRKGRGLKRWRYHEGHELVVAGSNGRAAQVRRARVRQWTPRAERRFLSVLAATCNVKTACAEVGLWPGSAYNHRKRSPGFAARWAEAEAIGYVRIETALVEAGGNLYSDPEVEPDIAITGMTAWDAFHLLRMHQHNVRGLGKAPGGPRTVATDAEIVVALTRRLKQFDRWTARHGHPGPGGRR